MSMQNSILHAKLFFSFFLQKLLFTEGRNVEKPALTSRWCSSWLLTLPPHCRAQENITIQPLSSWNQRDLMQQSQLVWPAAPPGCCHCSRWFLSPLRLLSDLEGPAHSGKITQTHFKPSFVINHARKDQETKSAVVSPAVWCLCPTNQAPCQSN